MRLYLVRHGETDGNKQKMLQGRMNIPLNAEGRAQALQAGKELKDIAFDLVISSPLLRAVETAELISGESREGIRIEDRIEEIAFGEFEGKNYREAGAEFEKFFTQPEVYIAAEGAESFESLIERTSSFLEDLKVNYADKTILAVSHGAAIHAMITYVKGNNLKDFWQSNIGNCAVTEIGVREGKLIIIKEGNIEDKNYKEC